MSHAAALIVAFRKAKYFNKKYYVWGFQSARNGKWYYTVTPDRPDFMLHLGHIT